MTGICGMVTGNCARAVAAGITCGLAGIPIMDAYAHMVGKGQGTFSSLNFALAFIAFITAILALNFLAGVISHAIATKPVRHQADAAIIGFVAGMALLLTELVVFGVRVVSDALNTLNMEGTGSDALHIDVLFMLLLVSLLVPGLAVNGALAAMGSMGYGQVKRNVS